jgi:hypothetical protein
MQFSKIASVAILFVLSFLGLAMASPTARATETDVEAIITSLKATITPNIANISKLTCTTVRLYTLLTHGLSDAIAKQNPLTFGDAASDVIAITKAFNDANLELNALTINPSAKRQLDLSNLSTLVASLLNDVATTVNQVASSPLIAILLPGLDIALAGLLRGLETLLAGVLTLVATL